MIFGNQLLKKKNMKFNLDGVYFFNLAESLRVHPGFSGSRSQAI
jgi:hypothetical protein